MKILYNNDMRARGMICKIVLLCCFVFSMSSWNGCCVSQVAPTEISDEQYQTQDSTINNEQSSQARELSVPDSTKDNNQHDWFFYFFNIIITTSLTLLVSYLNAKFELIKLSKEPQIDRLKTIVLAGIEYERKIYCDLKAVEEDLSCGNMEQALLSVTRVSNFLVDNKLDIKDSLYSLANDFIAYVTYVAQGKQSRNQQIESEFFINYVKEYRK